MSQLPLTGHEPTAPRSSSRPISPIIQAPTFETIAALQGTLLAFKRDPQHTFAMVLDYARPPPADAAHTVKEALLVQKEERRQEANDAEDEDECRDDTQPIEEIQKKQQQQQQSSVDDSMIDDDDFDPSLPMHVASSSSSSSVTDTTAVSSTSASISSLLTAPFTSKRKAAPAATVSDSNKQPRHEAADSIKHEQQQEEDEPELHHQESKHQDEEHHNKAELQKLITLTTSVKPIAVKPISTTSPTPRSPTTTVASSTAAGPTNYLYSLAGELLFGALPLCVLSVECNILDCNSAFLTLFGYTRADMLNVANLFTLSVPNEINSVFHMMEKLIEIAAKSGRSSGANTPTNSQKKPLVAPVTQTLHTYERTCLTASGSSVRLQWTIWLTRPIAGRQPVFMCAMTPLAQSTPVPSSHPLQPISVPASATSTPSRSPRRLSPSNPLFPGRSPAPLARKYSPHPIVPVPASCTTIQASGITTTVLKLPSEVVKDPLLDVTLSPKSEKEKAALDAIQAQVQAAHSAVASHQQQHVQVGSMGPLPIYPPANSPFYSAPSAAAASSNAASMFLANPHAHITQQQAQAQQFQLMVQRDMRHNPPAPGQLVQQFATAGSQQKPISGVSGASLQGGMLQITQIDNSPRAAAIAAAKAKAAAALAAAAASSSSASAGVVAASPQVAVE